MTLEVATELSPSLIADLEEMPNQLEGALQLIPPESRAWRPDEWGGSPGEMFSAIEHVCHLRDIEVDGYQLRIRRLRDEDHPDLVPIDGYELATQRGYGRTTLTEALGMFREARRETIRAVRGLDERQLERTGTFAEYGHVTLRGMIHFLRSHDQQHLSCLQWLLGKMASRTGEDRRSR
jgi:hypothetical protein